MRFRSLSPIALGCLGALLILGASNPTLAASIAFRSPAVDRTVATHNTDPNTPWWVSRSDCLSDDVLTFHINITDAGGAPLEVWVGQGSTDCTVKAARTPPAATCLRVYSGPSLPNIQDVPIRVRDLALADSGTFGPDGQAAGTVAVCDKSGASAADQVSVTFMLISSSDAVATLLWTNTSVDLLGPAPPTNVKLGPGENLVEASWDLASDVDRIGYEFFCDPPPGGLSDAAPGTTSGTGTGGSGGSGGSGVTDDAGDAVSADGSDGADGSGGSSGAGGTGASTGNCSTTLVPNALPTLDVINRYRCGGTVSSTSKTGQIGNLANGVPVTVAVASFDRVFNVGPLSQVACTTPDLINDFARIYHDAGGTAGGGFCSMGWRPGRGAHGAIGGTFLLFFGVWARRRRRVAHAELATDFDTTSQQ